MQRDTIQIEQWPLDRLLPYAANARTHPDEQVAQIAGSIAEFGFNVPCLVDERGVLVAGHGRLLAAQRLGLSQVPVIRLDHLSDAQARAAEALASISRLAADSAGVSRRVDDDERVW